MVSCCQCAPVTCCAGAVSQTVLLEAERNIRTKLSPHAFNAYRDLLQAIPFTLAPVPRIPAEAAWLEAVNAKDTHVVFASLYRHAVINGNWFPN